MAWVTRLSAALRDEQLEEAWEVLRRATEQKQIQAAVAHVVQRDQVVSRAFGTASSPDAMFLLGSISKPIAITALMALYDQAAFQLDDLVRKYLPGFTGDGRETVTIRHLLTHVSGLPDQLPNNNELRARHSPLSVFAEHVERTPLHFAPGTRYEYSSMGILLAARIAERISGCEIRQLVDERVFQPLGMRHSAQGIGRFPLAAFVPVQTERAAPESGGGDPTAKEWDWNSAYWRALGAPWGGTHCSAPDVARLLAEFLDERGGVLRPETARLMCRNHNPPALTPRGLGWNVGAGAGSRGCSARTFGHTGSTGTIAWGDPESRTIGVVLTSLPARAVTPHPRDLAAERIAASAG